MSASRPSDPAGASSVTGADRRGARVPRWLRFALVAALGSMPLVFITTVHAYGNFVSVTPQPVAPGQTITVHTDSWETNAPLAFYWGAGTVPISSGPATGTTSTNSFAVPSPLANGSYDLSACEAPNGPPSGCFAAPVHYFVSVATPATPPPVTAPPVPQHTPTPRPKPTQRPTTAPTPTPSPSPTPSPTATPASTLAPTPTPSQAAAQTSATVAAPAPPSTSPPALLRYDPVSEPKKVVDAQVAAFTLLALGTGGGLAAASAVGGAPARPPTRGGPKGGKVQSGKVKHVKTAEVEQGAPGDHSWTWRFPGTRWLDAVSVAIPLRLATRSPLLARIVVDGGFLRSMVGSLTLLLDLAGLVLGVLAVQAVSGHALPPPATLTIAIAVLGVFDALAGLIAVVAFVLGVAILGGIDSAAAVRTLLGLCALWTVVPLVAGAARPLRRAPATTPSGRWDRGADFVIASLIGAWAVQKIVAGLPGLAGLALPISHSADAAAIAVLAALVARMLAESLAANLYPRRLSAVHPARIPRPGPLQRIGANLVRTAVFVFIAVVVVGPSWQLWVGAALFLVPQLLSIYESRFPNVPSIYRVMPRGLLKLVLMLFVARWFGGLVLGAVHDHHNAIADAFVMLAIPGVLLSLLDLFGREGVEAPLRWRHRVGGAVILVVGLLTVAGVIG